MSEFQLFELHGIFRVHFMAISFPFSLLFLKCSNGESVQVSLEALEVYVLRRGQVLDSVRSGVESRLCH